MTPPKKKFTIPAWFTITALTIGLVVSVFGPLVKDQITLSNAITDPQARAIVTEMAPSKARVEAISVTVTRNERDIAKGETERAKLGERLDRKLGTMERNILSAIRRAR